jgi:hypothetical protein
MSDVVSDYNKTITSLSKLMKSKFPSAFKLTITEDDYTEGFVYRFFCQKINTKEITEVSDRNYRDLKRSPLYHCFDVEWKITGPDRNIMNEKVIQNQGVYEYNSESIDEIANIVPEIRNFLVNPLEFWRGY